jgi:hypothetical protein
MTSIPNQSVIKLFAVEDVVISVFGNVLESYSGGKSLVCNFKAIEPEQINLVSFFSLNPLLQVEHDNGVSDEALTKLHGQRFRAFHYAELERTFILRKVLS